MLALGLFPALIASGCSFAMVNRAKPKVQHSVCTDSYAWPVVDLVIAAAFSAGVGYRTMNGVSISSSGTTVRAGLALLTYSSFIYGSIHVDRCVMIRGNHVQSIEGNDTDPLSAPNPPAGPTAAPILASAPPSPSAAAAPASRKRLVVLEFQGKGLDLNILMPLSDSVRGGAAQGLVGRNVVVMSRENMLLKNTGKQACAGEDCELETARSLRANYMISAEIWRSESAYVATLKLRETESGRRIGMTRVDGVGQVELMRALTEHARGLVTRALGPR